MNQYLLVNMHLLHVANLGNRLAKAGPIMGAAIALGLTSYWRLDLAHFLCAAE